MTMQCFHLVGKVSADEAGWKNNEVRRSIVQGYVQPVPSRAG